MWNNCSESQSSKGINFSFTKTAKKQNLNQIKKDLNIKTDFVTSIDDNQIQSSHPENKKKELVIPLITTNRYRFKNTINKDMNASNTQSINNNINNNNNSINDQKQCNDSLEDMAKKELLREANKWREDNDCNQQQSSRVIPVIDSLIQNRVPEGFESDDKFDVSLRPIEPTLDDYESVPIQEFGLAMLRGMGWTPGQAIGANTKEMYTPVEPKIRPKGLGLGAESSLKEQFSKISKTVAQNEEELILKKGAFVSVEFGAHKGSYGVIEDFDDDMSRVTVKLSLKKESIKIPVALLRIVSKKEFQLEGNVINKTNYDNYKKEDKHRVSEAQHSSHSKDRPKKDKYEMRSHNHMKSTDSIVKHENKSENDNKDKYKKESTHSSWLLPNLKVRIIDKKYKNGRYYKEKVVIIDVLTPTKCCCKTEDKKILDDIEYKMLETVIPRHNDSHVMILFGEYKRELGVILDRNKNRNEANVQLLNDKRKIVTLAYDEICEVIDVI